MNIQKISFGASLGPNLKKEYQKELELWCSSNSTTHLSDRVKSAYDDCLNEIDGICPNHRIEFIPAQDKFQTDKFVITPKYSNKELYTCSSSNSLITVLASAIDALKQFEKK